MRRRPLFQVLAAILLILLMLIAPVTALQVAAQAPAPPNDTFGRALPLTIGAAAQGQIQPRGTPAGYLFGGEGPGGLGGRFGNRVWGQSVTQNESGRQSPIGAEGVAARAKAAAISRSAVESLRKWRTKNSADSNAIVVNGTSAMKVWERAK